MTRKLKFCKDLDLPLDTVTQTIGILARKGAGKTYSGMKLAEEMVSAGQQIVVADALGVWYGLRSLADGKGAGLPVVIMGGHHGDVPLDETSGEVLARFVYEEHVSVILDMSFMRKGAMIRLMTMFMETLFEIAGRRRTPLHIFLDEAQTFAPQRVDPDKARLLGAIEDIVCKGRSRGLGVTMMTQRASMLNKNVLSQCEVLVAMQTAGKHDRKAIDEWVEANGTPQEAKKLMDSIGTLGVGEAWVWSPSWLKHLGRHKIARRKTFDSSKTPEVGKTRIEPKRLAKVDMAAIKKKMGATIEKAKADDPRALKHEIKTLQAELAKAVKAKPAKPAKIVEKKGADIAEGRPQDVGQVRGHAGAACQGSGETQQDIREMRGRCSRPTRTPTGREQGGRHYPAAAGQSCRTWPWRKKSLEI